jgi:hypothetical protein
MYLGLTFLGWKPLGRISRTLRDALGSILNDSARAVGQTRAVLQADLILLLPGGAPCVARSFQRGEVVVSSRVETGNLLRLNQMGRRGPYQRRSPEALHHLIARDSCPVGLGLFRAGNSPLAPRARIGSRGIFGAPRDLPL